MRNWTCIWGRVPKGVAETLVEARDDRPADTENEASPPRNRKNGFSPKTIQGDAGKLPLDIPRDRNGTFQPQRIAKHQRRLAGFDEKILALYAKGMTTRDIQEIVKELYGVDVAPTLISEITEDLDAEVKAWQTRRLEAVWPIVFLDGIVVHIRNESGPVREHTMYVAIGVDFRGKSSFSASGWTRPREPSSGSRA